MTWNRRLWNLYKAAEKARKNPLPLLTPIIVYSSALTSGGHHAWLQTNVGRIRKPTGTFSEERLVKVF